LERADVTQLLRAPPDDARRTGELYELVYDKLRVIARQRMSGERAGHTLQSTALVNEAFMRLVGDDSLSWSNRAHFYAAAAEAMRRILVEHARARGRLKRGGGRTRVIGDVLDLACADDAGTILSFDEAFHRLEAESPEAARVVRLRFFAGLGLKEAAAALEMSERTVSRHWTFARAWLFRELEQADGPPES